MSGLTDSQKRKHDMDVINAYITRKNAKKFRQTTGYKKPTVVEKDIPKKEIADSPKPYQHIYHPPVPIPQATPEPQPPPAPISGMIETKTVAVETVAEVQELKTQDRYEPQPLPEPVKNLGLTPQDVLNNIRKQKERKEGFKKMDVAIKYGFIGVGQAGGRIAAEFGKLGYPTCAINTSEQDLSGIEVDQKLKIGSQGGAGKVLEVGLREAQENSSQIASTVRIAFAESVEYAIMCLGSSGGTGAGAWPVVLESLEKGGFKNKIGAIVTLPIKSEDTQAKKNTIKSLSDLSKASTGSTRRLSPLIIVDNDQILGKYPDLGITEFWEKANRDITLTFHKINLLAIQNPKFASTLDKEDYRRIITSGGCMIYGEGPLDNATNKDIMISMAKLTDEGLLAKGFNITDSNFSGVLFVGDEDSLKKFPMADQQFALNEMRKMLGAGTVFTGTYEIVTAKNMHVMAIIGDLGLPAKRVKDLIRETKEQVDQVQTTTEKKAQTVDDLFAEVENE